jgi:hypothetical protein
MAGLKIFMPGGKIQKAEQTTTNHPTPLPVSLL